jgi:hypothetical protein
MKGNVHCLEEKEAVHVGFLLQNPDKALEKRHN